MTTARWMREFVQNHPEYKQDSVVTDSINCDLMKLCADITSGEVHCPKLLPDYQTKTKEDIPMATRKAEVYLHTKAAQKRNNSGNSLQAMTNDVEH